MDKEIDRMVYELYGLTEDEIGIVEGRSDGHFGLFKRIRVGNYRIIFDDNNNVINIYDIKHRQEIYND